MAGGFSELANWYAQLRTIRVKSVPIADDGDDGARWEHSTTQRPVSWQMPEASAGSRGLDVLPPGGDSVGVQEAGSDKKG